MGGVDGRGDGMGVDGWMGGVDGRWMGEGGDQKPGLIQNIHFNKKGKWKS